MTWLRRCKFCLKPEPDREHIKKHVFRRRMEKSTWPYTPQQFRARMIGVRVIAFDR